MQKSKSRQIIFKKKITIIIITLFLSIKSRARLLNEPHTVANDAEKERLEKSKAKLTWSGAFFFFKYT